MSPVHGSDENPATVGRRGFLRMGITGGLAAAALPGFSGISLIAEAPAQEHSVAGGELDEKSIAELQEGMASGKYTSRRLVEIYLSRIDAIDKQGPTLNSVIEINPDALAIADSLDQERKEKGARGPMHGIPVLIKDNIATADKMETTAGSLALVGSKPPADAFAVQQLRKSGAVILGKTNLSEWANIRSTHSTSGWSGRGGLTKNPYALNRNTSGSSSGSAAAAAASLCTVAVGTETDGSIVSPSSLNGLVGIKPTVGLVSRTGIIPISHSQDTAGPMARTVRDAAILLGALAGADPDDNATQPAGRGKTTDYTQWLDPRALSGARIGVVREYFGFLGAVDSIINNSLEAMKQQGAVLVDVKIPKLHGFDDSELTVLLYELKADLNKYLARLGPETPVHTLKDVIDFNEKNAAKEMPYFGQETFLKAEEKGALNSKEYIDALTKNRRITRKEGIDAVMEKHKLDALVAPTDGPAWMTDLVTGDHFIGGSSQLAAVAGYPSVTVPAGFIFGLPIGVSFFGRAWSEAKLIGLAFAFEQVTKVRKAPTFLPTVDLQS